MKILNLSLDRSMLDKNSNLSKRVIEHGNLVDGYTIIVPDNNHKEVRLSEKAFAYGSGGANKFFQLISVYRIAKKLLERGNFDVVTVQDQYYLALVGLFLARKFRVGLELQIHGFEKYYGLRKIIARFVIPRANAVRCVSQRLKRQLIKEFGMDEEKITVVPVFTNTGNIKQTIKTKRNNFVFITVGRLAPVKNIGLQIKAMAEIIKKYSNPELWIIGDGQERKKLEREAEKLGVKNNVKFLGWQNNPEEFYSQADVFLLTSNYEGWGMVIIEAASYGLPIIMTNVGCAGELIENEKSGLIVPINNKAKLEEAMTRFINDDSMREKFSEGAFLAIKNLPSKEETLALYKKSWEIAINNK